MDTPSICGPVTSGTSNHCLSSHRCTLVTVAVAACLSLGAAARAGVVFGLTGNTLAGGYRWDASPRTVTLAGTPYERSLVGGLRYSVQGGSYQAYRDLFTWDTVPSVSDFTAAVQGAFAAWTAPDPVTSLATPLTFVPDFSTPVAGTATGGGVNPAGAEIDLFASPRANLWNPGNNNPQGETFFNAIGFSLTLTSGTPDYAGGAISGADVTLNNNPGAVYSLNFFRRLLTHELGHTLGLGDVEGDINPGAFIDDNYDGSSPAAALATLTNSWALLVDTTNPAASPLARFTVPYGNPGTLTPGVDILMESRGLGIAPGNPVTNPVPLTDDDYATRQFLYPTSTFVPEPGAAAWIACPLFFRRRPRA